jgi:carbon monoxide dehydrogenase subunit G
MDMTGERRIAAPRETVWQALNDPTVLKASIPGCESLEKLSDTDMKASASVKIGPIAARFNGAVHLSDIDPPNGYTIGGEGQGGVAGFAKGGAKVRLEPAGEATLLQYEVHAQVGGRIAQLGARLIDATAKQMADSFFDRFSAQVAAPAPEPETRDPETREPETRQIYPAAPSEEVAHPVLPMRPPPSAVSVFSLIPPEPMGLPLAAWIGGAIYLIMLILILGSMA